MSENVRFMPERLKELRQKENMTQKEFSEKISCTMASLSAYENGSKVPPTNTLINIASAFDCSIDWLLGLKETPVYDSKPLPIQTYSDYIKQLFLLDDAPIPLFKDCSCSYHDTDLSYYKGIAFSDPVIKLFLEKWRQTQKLYTDGTIDKTIYEAWQEKVLRDFHHFIIKDNDDTTWKDFHCCFNQFNEFPGFTEYDATLEALNQVTSSVTKKVPNIK